MKFLHFLARKSIDRKCLNSQLIRTGFANHMHSLADDITRGHCQTTSEAKYVTITIWEKQKNRIFFFFKEVELKKTFQEKVACLFNVKGWGCKSV